MVLAGKAWANLLNKALLFKQPDLDVPEKTATYTTDPDLPAKPRLFKQPDQKHEPVFIQSYRPSRSHRKPESEIAISDSVAAASSRVSMVFSSTPWPRQGVGALNGGARTHVRTSGRAKKSPGTVRFYHRKGLLSRNSRSEDKESGKGQWMGCLICVC